jgi:Skp family chaperone for outer membrane proteins
MESLTKILDMQYKQSYEQASKVKDIIQKYNRELSVLKKELKIKQKTLTTYEYLMKLPAEQEQEVLKCLHCSKFFVSKAYLQKHYAKHHPD